MAHLLCKCGCDMWNGETPNDFELYVYTDRTMCEKVLENDTIDTVGLAGMNDYDVWKCPECERLYVFKNVSGEEGNRVLRVYKPEDE